ncbi:MAG: hypothetical protein IJR70_08875 [Eubacterium sp.]|nr:hypothetical protein [Eubacterium sp.]
MEYRFGNAIKIKEHGLTEKLTCPNCDKKVSFSVFSNSDGRLDSKFPFYKTCNVFILVCPECSSVFTVDEDKADTFKKGEKLSIGNFDLKEPEKFEV